MADRAAEEGRMTPPVEMLILANLVNALAVYVGWAYGVWFGFGAWVAMGLAIAVPFDRAAGRGEGL